MDQPVEIPVITESAAIEDEAALPVVADDQSGPEIEPEPDPVQPMHWDALVEILQGAESTDSRICRVWHPHGPHAWNGIYGGAPVESGPPAYQLNDGTVVTL